MYLCTFTHFTAGMPKRKPAPSGTRRSARNAPRKVHGWASLMFVLFKICLELAVVDVNSMISVASVCRQWCMHLRSELVAKVRLNRFRYIHRLSFRRYSILSCITGLDLSLCSYITNTTLKSLKHLPNLLHLNISRSLFPDCSMCTLNGTGFDSLSEMVKLKSLDLSRIRVSSEYLTKLQALTNLERLCVPECTMFAQQFISCLLPMIGLKYLKFGYGCFELSTAAISDSCVHMLCQLTSLTYLDISWWQGATASSFDHIYALTNIRTLHMSGKYFKDRGAGLISRCIGLTNLSLTGTLMTGVGVSHLSKLVNLRRLDLSSSLITGEGFRSISTLSHLTCLNLSFCIGLTEMDLTCLYDMANLQFLCLLNLPFSVTDNTLVGLGGLPNLLYLNLYQTSITDVGIHSLLVGGTKLHTLYLDGTDITGEAMSMLIPLRSLKYVSVVYCIQLPRESLIHFAMSRMDVGVYPYDNTPAIDIMTNIDPIM